MSSDVSVVAYLGAPCWSNCRLRWVSFPWWVYIIHRHLCCKNKSWSSHLHPEPRRRVGPTASRGADMYRRPSRVVAGLDPTLLLALEWGLDTLICKVRDKRGSFLDMGEGIWSDDPKWIDCYVERTLIIFPQSRKCKQILLNSWWGYVLINPS